MSKISIVISYKCSNRCEILFDQLRIRLNVVSMCKIGIKYQYLSRVVCAYAQIFQKRPGCVLIGACALIRIISVLDDFGSLVISFKSSL